MSIMIEVQQISRVTEKLKAQIQEWPALEGKPIVERAEVVNQDFSKTPWVGIYRQMQTFEPRTLGLGTGFRRHNITLALVLQESSVVNGEDCEAKLEKLVAEVVSAILSDPTMRGTCIAFSPEAFVLNYSSYRIEDNSYFQEAVLQFTVVANVNATAS